MTLYEDDEGMRKLGVFFLLIAISLAAAWCWVYGSYLALQGEVADRAGRGDWHGAREALYQYRGKTASLSIDRLPFLKKFKNRLRYNEGVVSAKLGDQIGASRAFSDASHAAEKNIAALSHYNLALYALGRQDMETARMHFSRALCFQCWDKETKVNLELVLKEIKARDADARKTEMESDKKPGLEQQPGEQWRLDIPEYEGPGGIGSGRSYL